MIECGNQLILKTGNQQRIHSAFPVGTVLISGGESFSFNKLQLVSEYAMLESPLCEAL